MLTKEGRDQDLEGTNGERKGIKRERWVGEI